MDHPIAILPKPDQLHILARGKRTLSREPFGCRSIDVSLGTLSWNHLRLVPTRYKKAAFDHRVGEVRVVFFGRLWINESVRRDAHLVAEQLPCTDKSCATQKVY